MARFSATPVTVSSETGHPVIPVPDRVIGLVPLEEVPIDADRLRVMRARKVTVDKSVIDGVLKEEAIKWWGRTRRRSDGVDRDGVSALTRLLLHVQAEEGVIDCRRAAQREVIDRFLTLEYERGVRKTTRWQLYLAGAVFHPQQFPAEGALQAPRSPRTAVADPRDPNTLRRIAPLLSAKWHRILVTIVDLTEGAGARPTELKFVQPHDVQRRSVFGRDCVAVELGRPGDRRRVVPVLDSATADRLWTASEQARFDYLLAYSDREPERNIGNRINEQLRKRNHNVRVNVEELRNLWLSRVALVLPVAMFCQVSGLRRLDGLDEIGISTESHYGFEQVASVMRRGGDGMSRNARPGMVPPAAIFNLAHQIIVESGVAELIADYRRQDNPHASVGTGAAPYSLLGTLVAILVQSLMSDARHTSNLFRLQCDFTAEQAQRCGMNFDALAEPRRGGSQVFDRWEARYRAWLTPWLVPLDPDIDVPARRIKTSEFRAILRRRTSADWERSQSARDRLVMVTNRIVAASIRPEMRERITGCDLMVDETIFDLVKNTWGMGVASHKLRGASPCGRMYSRAKHRDKIVNIPNAELQARKGGGNAAPEISKAGFGIGYTALMVTGPPHDVYAVPPLVTAIAGHEPNGASLHGLQTTLRMHKANSFDRRASGRARLRNLVYDNGYTRLPGCNAMCLREGFAAVSTVIGNCPCADMKTARRWPIGTARWRT